MLAARITAGLALALAFASFSAAAQTVIRFSHTQPETMTSGSHAMAVVFKDIVESGSGGKIVVRIQGANAAGDERQQIEKVRNGINQMSANSEITQPSFFEPAKVLGIPFLFSSDAIAWKVLDGEFGQKYAEGFRMKVGVRILGHINAGYRSIFNSKREINTPADLKGLKIRVGENPIHIEMMKALGASPTPIAWPEVYTSLQQGVVDGMENPPSLFYAMKFYEHQKYLTLDKHLFSVHTLFINDAFYNGLPADHKVLITEAARVAIAVGRSTTYLAEKASLDQLREKGIKIHIPTAGEYAKFKSAGRPSAEKLVRDQIGDEWVDLIGKNIDKEEASLRAGK